MTVSFKKEVQILHNFYFRAFQIVFRFLGWIFSEMPWYRLLGSDNDDNDDHHTDDNTNDDLHFGVFPKMLAFDFDCSAMKLFSSSL